MFKKIILTFFCMFFASSAFAATQYYYLSATGSGRNSGDNGIWNSVPSSDNNAMSAGNFNDLRNWSATDNVEKLDPDDIVYVKGVWKSGYDLTISYGITLDLYESGNYDPETMSHHSEPVFKSKIYIKSNDVTIQDGRFDWSARSVIVEEPSKIQRIKVLRNYFNISREGGWAAIFFGFVCDSEVAYNYFEGIPHSKCQATVTPTVSAGRGFVMCAGSRNKIHHNHIAGGWTGLYFPGARTWDSNKYTTDYPSSGSYTADPDANYENNEISYNYIERRCQEGISYDLAGSPTSVYSCSTMERDTVASISGTTVTLNNSDGEWTGAGNLYSGYYMVAAANRDNTYGNHALIKFQSGNSFTLSSTISNLAVGDTVVIGMVFRRNWIHHNTFGTQGFNGSSILLSGISLENLVEDNTLPKVNWTEGMGIHFGAYDGYVKAYNSITKTYAYTPTAYNIMRNNTLGRPNCSVYDHNYGPSAGIISRNNAIYDNNVYKDDYHTRYVHATNSNVYVDSNGVATQFGKTGELRATDPTGYVSDYFKNWAPNKQALSLSIPRNVAVIIDQP